jgi:hypothetical protein
VSFTGRHARVAVALSKQKDFIAVDLIAFRVIPIADTGDTQQYPRSRCSGTGHSARVRFGWSAGPESHAQAGHLPQRHDKRISWTPDGRQIAYSALDGDRMHIFTVAVSGGQPIRITDGWATACTRGSPPMGGSVSETWKHWRSSVAPAFPEPNACGRSRRAGTTRRTRSCGRCRYTAITGVADEPCSCTDSTMVTNTVATTSGTSCTTA